MRKLTKIIALFLTVVLMLSFVACSSSNKVSVPSKVDYFDTGKEFNFFTYKSLSKGGYNVLSQGADAVTQYSLGKTLVDEQHIKEYFDSGMKFMSPQVVAVANSDKANGWGNTKFEETPLGQLLDKCEDLGFLNSVVISDNQFSALYGLARDSLSNEEKIKNWKACTIIGKEIRSDINPNEKIKFESEADLDAFVKRQLEQYYSHPAFQGVFLPDEPSGFNMNAIGELYRSIRRVEKDLKAKYNKTEDMYININLLPQSSNDSIHYGIVDSSFSSDPKEVRQEAYKRYIEMYFEATQADYVQVDIYPMLTDGMEEQYILNLQIMAEVAKENDAKIIVVTQVNNDQRHRRATYESVKYLNNIVLGFGAENIGYYAYYTLDDGLGGYGGLSYIYDDSGCMVNRFGDKTAVYDIVKDLNAEAQKLAPFILNFDYKTSKPYLNNAKSSANSGHINFVSNYMKSSTKTIDYDEFTKLKDFKIDKEMAVVTELYDKDRDNYMYMVMNATDPLYKGSVYYQTATVTFASEYNKALVFFNGEFKTFDLDEAHSLSVSMRPGEAHYIIPYAE